MKAILTILAAVIAGSVHATIIPLAVSVAITASVQNQNITDVNGYTTIGNPIAARIDTAYLLSQLAADENRLGNYGFTAFPIGSKLVMLNNDTNIYASTFIVVNSVGFQLVDVSDLIQFFPSGNNEITSGKQSDATGLQTRKDTYVGTLVFDDTGAAGGHTQFELVGMVTATVTQTLLSPLTYKETITGSLKSGTGEGFLNNQQMTVTGSVLASGSKSPIFFP